MISKKSQMFAERMRKGQPRSKRQLLSLSRRLLPSSTLSWYTSISGSQPKSITSGQAWHSNMIRNPIQYTCSCSFQNPSVWKERNQTDWSTLGAEKTWHSQLKLSISYHFRLDSCSKAVKDQTLRVPRWKTAAPCFFSRSQPYPWYRIVCVIAMGSLGLLVSSGSRTSSPCDIQQQTNRARMCKPAVQLIAHVNVPRKTQRLSIFWEGALRTVRPANCLPVSNSLWLPLDSVELSVSFPSSFRNPVLFTTLDTICWEKWQGVAYFRTHKTLFPLSAPRVVYTREHFGLSGLLKQK